MASRMKASPSLPRSSSSQDIDDKKSAGPHSLKQREQRSAQNKPSTSHLLYILFVLASNLFVGSQLWQSHQQVDRLRTELHATSTRCATPSSASQDDSYGLAFYNIRPSPGDIQPLTGQELAQDSVPIYDAEPPTTLHRMFGQVDEVGNSQIRGWACMKAEPDTLLTVQAFIGGRLVAATTAAAPAESAAVGACSTPTAKPSAAGFTIDIPPLKQGPHTARLFLLHPTHSYKVEMSSSPLTFAEMRSAPSVATQLARREEIIKVRNVQVAHLWSELHAQLPWRLVEAQGSGHRESEGDADKPEVLGLILVMSGHQYGSGRGVTRGSWMKPERLEALGLAARFVVGSLDSAPSDVAETTKQEIAEHGDLWEVPAPDGGGLVGLLKAALIEADRQFKAQFVVKVDRSVLVNPTGLAAHLTSHKGKPNLYMGCKASGEIITELKSPWFEPLAERFGLPLSRADKRQYPAHAVSNAYGMSGTLARFLARSAPVLQTYANEDTTVGAWMLGLQVELEDSGAYCHAPGDCGDATIAVTQPGCPGLCAPEKDMAGITKKCVDPQLQAGGSHADHH